MKEEYEKIVSKYVEAFCEKHEMEFDFWVADLKGTIASFSCEWFVNFEDIRLDIDNKVDKDVFCKWYYIALDLAIENKPVINYYNYLKLNA